MAKPYYCVTCCRFRNLPTDELGDSYIPSTIPLKNECYICERTWSEWFRVTLNKLKRKVISMAKLDDAQRKDVEECCIALKTANVEKKKEIRQYLWRKYRVRARLRKTGAVEWRKLTKRSMVTDDRGQLSTNLTPDHPLRDTAPTIPGDE